MNIVDTVLDKDRSAMDSNLDAEREPGLTPTKMTGGGGDWLAIPIRSGFMLVH